jgi:hypothetical protein
VEDGRRQSHQGDADAYRDQPKQGLGQPLYLRGEPQRGHTKARVLI